MIESLLVLIATAGKQTQLEDTLESLSQCIKPTARIKTLVVENGIQYQAEKITAKYARNLNAEYLYTPIANKSAALNYALKKIEDHTLIFFTDDDILFAEGLLVAYEKSGAIHSKGCFFGGPTIPNYERSPPSWLIPSLPPSAKGYAYEAPFKDSMFLGSNWAAFAKDIKQVGGFNPRFGPGTVPKITGQETDMQKRLLEHSLSPIFVPEAKVWHFVPSQNLTLRWLLKRKYQGGRGKGMRQVLYSKKKPHLLPFGILSELLSDIIALLFSSFSGKEKVVSSLCKLVTTIGKIRGFYMKAS